MRRLTCLFGYLGNFFVRVCVCVRLHYSNPTRVCSSMHWFVAFAFVCRDTTSRLFPNRFGPQVPICLLQYYWFALIMRKVYELFSGAKKASPSGTKDTKKGQ